MECIPISALRVGNHDQRIRVRASRVCHYRGGLEDGEVKEIRMVLIDEEVRNYAFPITCCTVLSHVSISVFRFSCSHGSFYFLALLLLAIFILLSAMYALQKNGVALLYFLSGLQGFPKPPVNKT
jgi:hypothetical protein